MIHSANSRIFFRASGLWESGTSLPVLSEASILPSLTGGGAGGEAKGAYIRRLAADMLAVCHSAHSPIQLLASVAAADVYGFVEVLAQGFQHLFAQVPDVRHQCRRHSVVDVESGGRLRPLELF